MKQTDLIKIMITKRNQKTPDGKKKFPVFRTKMNIVVKGEEEKGKQPKWVTVKFPSDVDTKELTRGLLTVKVADISFPRIYEVVEDENGKKEYPVVWVREFKEFRETIREIENPFITEESDTEETDIDSEEQ